MADLGDKVRSGQFKMFDSNNQSIVEGIKLLKRCLPHKDLIEKSNVSVIINKKKIKSFLEKIVDNSHLILAYRDLIKNELLVHIK